MTANGQTDYVRVATAGTGLRSFLLVRKRSSLWLAPDHVLLVRHRSFLDTYRRFYFSDIQAIVIGATSLYATITAALALLALVWLTFLGAAISWGVGNAVFSGVALGLTAALLLRHALLGPTCKCQIRTSLQTEEIPCLSRLRAANRARQRLIPLIETAQGPLEENDLDPAVTATSVSPSVGTLVDEQNQTARHEQGKFHKVFFYLLLLTVLSNIFDLFYLNGMKNHADYLLWGALILSGIIAIIKQRKSDLPVSVRNVTFLGFGFKVVHFLFFRAFLVINVTRGNPIPRPGLLELQPAWNEQVFAGSEGISAIVCAVCALIGLKRLHQLSRSRSQAELGNEIGNSEIAAEPAPEHSE